MQTKHQKKLATNPIGKLLWQFSLPATIGMLVQTLYNVVDTIFVGHSLGSIGIAALSIVFPIQMFITAISQVIAVGSGSLISIFLGAKEQEQAETVFGNAIMISMLLGIILTAIGLAYTNSLLRFFGSTISILPYARQYLGTIVIGTCFVMFSMITNNIVRAEGNAKIAMLTMIISALINTALDPIFIFTFKMGIKGAAIATVISQACAAIYLLYYFLANKSSLRFHLKNLIIKPALSLRVTTIGSASFARIATSSTTAIILNHILGLYGGNMAIATYGILNRTFMFILMPLIGISQGLQPIIGFNYGAKNYDRVIKAVKLGIKVASTISVIAATIIFFFMGNITHIFTNESTITDLARHAALFISPTLTLLGFQVLNNNMFEAIGKAKPAFFISILRGVVFLLPLLFIMPHFLHLNGIWISFPIADILSFSIVTILFAAQMRKFTACAHNNKKH